MLGLERIVGQEQVVRRLQEFTDHFRQRVEAADHILLIGPDGMGKATIAKALSETLGVGIRACDSRSLEKKGDLTAILTSLEYRDVFFLENVHRLRQPVSETLFPALRQFRIDLIIGQGSKARIHPYQLNRFTCVGTVEKESDISPKLRDEFPLALKLQPYSVSQLSKIAVLVADGMSRALEPSAAPLIANASEGSPHHAEVLIRRIGTEDGQHVTEGDVRRYLSIVGLRVEPLAAPGVAIPLDNLSGVEFEKLVAALIGRMGFRVETTKATGDGGIDIIATFEKLFLRGRYLVQCKRFSVGNAVGAPVIREFYGAVRADHKAVKGIFITTSSFTEQAKEFAENLALELIDRARLQQLLAEYGVLK